METLEWATVDKSKFGPGAWQDEPDKMQWPDKATGLPCLIVRGPVGALCGYVGVGPAHPWYGRSYSDRLGECTHNTAGDDDFYCWECPTVDGKIEVHGGVTFSGSCQHGADPATGICHMPAAGEPDNVWWFGFDTAHCGDLTPSSLRYGFTRGETYKDVDYLRAEVAQLAAQLAVVS